MSDTFSSPDPLLFYHHISSINSSFPRNMYCLITKPGSLIYITLFIINIVILFPLCTFILHHGYQECQKQRSTSSAASMSHCDCFTYHMVVMEMIGVIGYFICCWGIYRRDFQIIDAGFFPFTLNYYGQTLFHTLTCVERYLAVVHPITYLSLRQKRGIRIRNVIIGCVWLICFALMGLVLNDQLHSFLSTCIITVTLAVISFCSLSVLFVLIRPGPGEQSGDRKKVDSSKKRAFHTIVVILVTLVLRFTWCLIWATNYALESEDECVMTTSNLWFNLPCSLVLPLLLLHRAGKVKCWRGNTQ